ncbi:hypothetical protein CLIB1444_14S00650 [[Candida] jaroonii]|uniref:Uncharacterized protein n=1 Tax=[Candida] jaroonii TaxID=467808 RepID=A0ACA9YFE6_9ASCO|nr:hypothetical protein CLIB1444_14S00650 [[Candida] jaroonii]
MMNIPRFYDIPNRIDGGEWQLRSIDQSNFIINNYPLTNISYTPNKTVTVSGPFNDDDTGCFLVRLNPIFKSNDIIFTKVSWPATLPVDFTLSHDFIPSKTLDNGDDFDIYVNVTYHFNYKSYKPVTIEELKFNLVIEVLPNRLPIPIEVYDIIRYQVGLLLIIVPLLPDLLEWFGLK